MCGCLLKLEKSADGTEAKLVKTIFVVRLNNVLLNLLKFIDFFHLHFFYLR